MIKPNFHNILNEAYAAASDACATTLARTDDHSACGFAWVKIDGREPLAHFCRKEIKNTADAAGRNAATRGDDDEQAARVRRLAAREAESRYGHKGYPTGWEFWMPGRGGAPGCQSVHIFEAGADAFRDVLAKYGIRANSASRLD